MSDEEVTYATVRFHKSSELQNGGRSDETQGPRETGHRECSVPWHLIAIPLGILCSILLVTVAVLVKHIFQYSQEKHELQKTLNNLQQNYSTMQNESYLREEMLKNKSIEYDACKNHLDSHNREESRCYGETKIVLDLMQYKGTSVEGNGFCCGTKCYYFIMGNVPWNECKQICQDCRSSLLKIDDDDELKFLKSKLTTNTYWIGLKYIGNKKEWQWIDNDPSKLDIQPDDCGRSHPCICEKRMDKFPNSVCRKKDK